MFVEHTHLFASATKPIDLMINLLSICGTHHTEKETSNDLYISAIVVIQSEKMRSIDTTHAPRNCCCSNASHAFFQQSRFSLSFARCLIFFNFMWLSNYNVYGGLAIRVRTPQTTTKSWYEYIYWMAINWTILLCCGHSCIEKVIDRHKANAAAFVAKCSRIFKQRLILSRSLDFFCFQTTFFG